MKSVIVPFAFVLSLFAAGCACPWMKEFNEPERPTFTNGWQPHDIGAITIVGQFVLNKGQSVNNGDVGIKVIDINAGSCSAFHEPKYPTTKLQFFRVADQKILCEHVFHSGGGRLDVIEGCGKSLRWNVLSISGINSKDNWVAFDLR